jgi:serine/threonine protein kinase
MGEVDRARDTRLDRTVASKILPEALAADPQFRARFDREARAVSSLNHPHICTLFDIGHAHPSPQPSPLRGEGARSAGEGAEIDFLVMEYLDGETLAARVARGALKVSDALQIATQIAAALDVAHRAGIVHSRPEAGQHFLMLAGPHPRSRARRRIRGWRGPRALC